MGPGAAERAKVLKALQNDVWGPLMAGQKYDKAKMSEYYKLMAEDIAKQKQRIGGNWATAMVVFSRGDRDMIRNMFGNVVTFVHLVMNTEDKKKRLQKRHADGSDSEMMLKAMEVIKLTLISFVNNS